MSSVRLVSIVIGVVWVAFGVITVFHRGVRKWGARAPFHRALYGRAPWLYPGPLRHLPFDERLWRGITIFTGILLIVIGLLAILGIGVE